MQVNAATIGFMGVLPFVGFNYWGSRSIVFPPKDSFPVQRFFSVRSALSRPYPNRIQNITGSRSRSRTRRSEIRFAGIPISLRTKPRAGAKRTAGDAEQN